MLRFLSSRVGSCRQLRPRADGIACTRIRLRTPRNMDWVGCFVSSSCYSGGEFSQQCDIACKCRGAWRVSVNKHIYNIYVIYISRADRGASVSYVHRGVSIMMHITRGGVLATMRHRLQMPWRLACLCKQAYIHISRAAGVQAFYVCTGS
jgi:hypothetical protein